MESRHEGRRVVLLGRGSTLTATFSARLTEDGAVVVPVGETAEVTCDCTDAEAIRAAIGTVADRLDGIDALVHAPPPPPTAALADVKDEQWQHANATTVTALLHATQAVLPAFAAAGSGRIVALSSAMGRQSLPGRPLDVVLSLAVVGLVRALASELGPRGVTVNAIAPSLHGDPSDPDTATITASQAISRAQQPGDLAGTVSFLLSDDAAFVTGQTFQVDGGLIPF